MSEKELKITERKTSEYAIKKLKCSIHCKDCKLLGNLPDTQNEFKSKKKT